MKPPEVYQTNQFIKSNLKEGDWVWTDIPGRDFMVIKRKVNQILLGNGAQRVFKPISKIKCILIDN